MHSAHITLAPCAPAHYPALSAYRLSGEQASFSRAPCDWLNGSIPYSAAQLAVSILRDGEAIGFFVLDSGADRAAYSANPRAVLLRSMSLNPKHQGNGHAYAALTATCLNPFVQAHLPACEEIVLGVHHANHSAVRLYQRAGFHDSGRTHMGLKGLQYIFYRRIARAD